jgi:hypothetical protein
LARKARRNQVFSHFVKDKAIFHIIYFLNEYDNGDLKDITTTHETITPDLHTPSTHTCRFSKGNRQVVIVRYNDDEYEVKTLVMGQMHNEYFPAYIILCPQSFMDYMDIDVEAGEPIMPVFLEWCINDIEQQTYKYIVANPGYQWNTYTQAGDPEVNVSGEPTLDRYVDKDFIWFTTI